MSDLRPAPPHLRQRRESPSSLSLPLPLPLHSLLPLHPSSLSHASQPALTTRPQALEHPYFFALPYPSHPSKLPKPAKKDTGAPLDEVDGNVDPARANGNKLKRKHSADELAGRPVARRLDFTK